MCPASGLWGVLQGYSLNETKLLACNATPGVNFLLVYGALKGAKIAVAACRMGIRGNFKNEEGEAIALSDHQKAMQPNGVVSPFHTSIVS